MTFKNMIPMLNVSQLETSLEFYEKALGFQVVSPTEAIASWRWANIRSGNVELMLSESDCEMSLKQGIHPHEDTSWPCIYYFYPNNIGELHKQLIQQGFSPTRLEVTDYGMREFSLQDPDGHMLSFGEDANLKDS